MRFTIGRKVWLGFGVIILLNLVVFLITNVNVSKSSEINNSLTNVYGPSEENLENFILEIEKSRILALYWGNVESINEAKEKEDLREIIGVKLPNLIKKIDSLSVNWPSEQQALFASASARVDTLVGHYDEIRDIFPNFRSYKDPDIFALFKARDLLDREGPIMNVVQRINADVEGILGDQRTKSDTLLFGMNDSFDQMRFLVTVIGGILILLGILIAILTARAIVNPTQRLRDKLMSLSKGVIPSEETSFSNDEIGDMSTALNQLISGQTKVQNFVNAIGTGDFKVKYEPLSEMDQMAPSFIKTRDELAENERITEKKITERTEELAEKNRIVTELYQDLKDSITYAKRLQDSILPTEEMINDVMGESFIYFRPKETVSGDFYWVKNVRGKKTFAAIDCTGHGVPGAFMSLIGYNSLNRAFAEVNSNDPAKILDAMDSFATKSLNRNKGEHKVRDGMDMGLCIYDPDTKVIHYSGAGRPLTYVRNGKIVKLKGDRHAIGGATDAGLHFSSESVQLQKGDTVYIFSDGYADQFGGNEDPDKLKKFKVGPFYRMLEEMSTLDMGAQEETLDKALLDWQGDHPQIDDIIVMGVSCGMNEHLS